MSTINSGLLVMSAVASGSGMTSLSESVLRLRQRMKQASISKRRARRAKPLDSHQKEQLLQSILKDDWHE